MSKRKLSSSTIIIFLFCPAIYLLDFIITNGPLYTTVPNRGRGYAPALLVFIGEIVNLGERNHAVYRF